MSGEYARLGHPTSKLPPAASGGEPVDQDEVVTKVRCPVCQGAGFVTAEVCVSVDLALAMRKDDS